MTRKAYVLVETEIGKVEAVANALRGKAGVVAADVVTGPHDIIVTIQGADADALAKLVIDGIQTTKGVNHTTTYIVIGDSGNK